MENVLEVRDLRTSFWTPDGEVQAVAGIGLTVGAGEAVAVVGESGCGKTATALSVMRLLPPNGRIAGGSIQVAGRDVVALSEAEMRRLRGKEIAMIFQDPMTALNPVLTIGTQLMEPLRLHLNLDRKTATQRAVELLGLVGIPDPERRLGQYPHQLSGGMRQRVMIAMALACQPRLLIADEPTTALDVTIQAQIIELLMELKQRLGTAILLITHDLGLVARLCQRVVVMYAGRVVEAGPVERIFHQPQHPYTWGLLRSRPRLDVEVKELVPIPGQPPDLLRPPAGCPFAPRCPHVLRACLQWMPPLRPAVEAEGASGHEVACWLQELGPAAVAGARQRGIAVGGDAA